METIRLDVVRAVRLAWAALDAKESEAAMRDYAQPSLPVELQEHFS